MGIKFSNNAEGTLTQGIGSGDTTDMQLTSGDSLLFPTIVLESGNYFYATLVDQSGNREIIKVTEHQAASNEFQLYIRAQDDTDAIAFEIGDKIQIRFPKIVLEQFRDDIAANLAAIESNDSDITNIEAKSTADEQVLYGPTGLVMFIYNPENEIPTGWSIHDAVGDCLLALADQDSGGLSYDVAGGSDTEVGSWTPTGHVHTGPSHVHTMNTHIHTMPSHTHTTPGHQLSDAEMPSHNHIEGLRLFNVLAGAYAYGTVARGTVTVAADILASSLAGVSGYTSTSGSDASHAHGDTGSKDPGDTNATDPGDTNASGTANTGSSKEPSTDRPYAAVGLLIERD